MASKALQAAVQPSRLLEQLSKQLMTVKMPILGTALQMMQQLSNTTQAAVVDSND